MKLLKVIIEVEDHDNVYYLNGYNKCIISKSDCTLLPDNKENILIAKAGEKVKVVSIEAPIGKMPDVNIEYHYELVKDLYVGGDFVVFLPDNKGIYVYGFAHIDGLIVEFEKVSNQIEEQPLQTIHFNWLDFRSGKFDVVEKETLFPINLEIPISKFIGMVDNVVLIPKTETVFVNVYHGDIYHKTLEKSKFNIIYYPGCNYIETIEIKRPIK